MRRTNNHVTRYRCKDVAVSFARRRASLIQLAQESGATVLHDDGQSYHAECFNSSRQRLVFRVCVKGAPFVNGPAIITSIGAVEYSELLLPKLA